MKKLSPRQIFISHVTEEREVASLLKDTLIQAFGDSISVFVSSDGSGIAGGEEWFACVRKKAKLADVVLVLLSVDSADNAWLTFEAGLGDGSDASIIPILFGALRFEELLFPLGGFQSLRLEDIRALVSDIGKRLELRSATVAEEDFTSGRIEIERRKPLARLELRPIVRGKQISFELINLGNLTLDLIEIKAAAPGNILDGGAFFSNAQDHILSVRSETRDGRPVRVIRLNTHTVTRSNTGIHPLPTSFSPGMSPLQLPNFLFVLKEPLEQVAKGEKLTTTISIKRYPPVVREVDVCDLLQTD